MGSIALVEKDVNTYYNGIYVYEGSGHVGAGGWGVRERSAEVAGNSVVSLLYTAPIGMDISYVSFRVNTPTAAADEVKFSIWKKTRAGGSYIRVYRYTIDQTVVDAQYGTGVWGVATDQIYTIELPEPVHIIAEAGYTYYVAVYSSGARLDYDTTGSINGARWVAADMSLTDTYLVAGTTLSNWAVSFECFTEPDTWTALTLGGAIAEDNDDWQWETVPGTPDYISTDPAHAWANPRNIWAAGDATSALIDDAIYIDVSGDETLSGWDPAAAASLRLFPDYTTYGVRAMCEITMTGALDAGGNDTILVQVNDQDETYVAPPGTPWVDVPTGWQTMYTITGNGAYNVTFYIPVIARWIRLKHGGASNAITITDFSIKTISYSVDDGDFPVDMINTYHECWVENYPTEVKIRKAAVKNMAGAVGTPGLPFTNRENVD